MQLFERIVKPRGATCRRKCSHRQLPSTMADICRDWLTGQTTDCRFVVIGSSSHPTIHCSAAKNRSIWIQLVRHLRWQLAGHRMSVLWPVQHQEEYTVWVNKSPPPNSFLTFFPKRLEIFNKFFTHLLYVTFYTRLQNFIQLSPTLTKLCHTKRDHPSIFHISLELNL